MPDAFLWLGPSWLNKGFPLALTVYELRDLFSLFHHSTVDLKIDENRCKQEI